MGRGSEQVLRVGPLTINPQAYRAEVQSPTGAVTLDLTRTEFRILAHMAASQGRAFERSELVDACLPEGEALDRTVDSHVSNLRRKLAAAGADGMLTAVRGVGYRLDNTCG
ncbi:DNA-binding response OmpR family regulator [Rhodopseudomonas julia]|uniref:DNA-binding response OmpR family regulator n=1 Tax=Rhodopseudomonas julia TaxID=200617 RepID=A0ABU0C624_9BRAD|nr:DNA-binding response OmpR family regulator [Rhodopseudomonas julia]